MHLDLTVSHGDCGFCQNSFPLVEYKASASPGLFQDVCKRCAPLVAKLRTLVAQKDSRQISEPTFLIERDLLFVKARRRGYAQK
jgi:hypothetical protein